MQHLYGAGPYGDTYRGPYGDGQVPVPAGQPVGAQIAVPGYATSSLSPPSHWARMQQYGQPGGPPEGYAWIRPQMFYPMPQILEGPGIAYQTRQRVLSFTSLTINVASVQTFRFDVPGPIYQFTGAAILSTGDAFPIGWDPLDTFRVQFQQANGDLLTETPVLGSTILGDAKNPAFTGRSAWLVDNGTAIVATVIPLFANLQVDLVAWHYEVRGPTNLTRS